MELTSNIDLVAEYALKFCDPPYSLESLVAYSRHTSYPVTTPGRLAILQCDGESSFLLPQLIHLVLQRFPGTTPVVRLDGEHLTRAVRLACLSGVLGARAVLMPGEDPEITLRPLLTLTPDPEDVVGLLRRRGIVADSAASDIRLLISVGIGNHRIANVLKKAGVSDSTLRHRLHAFSLAPPEKWRKLGAILRVVQPLQRRSLNDTPTKAIAQQLGYRNDKYLYRLLRRSIGVTPSTVAATLGWEWVVLAYDTNGGFEIVSPQAARLRKRSRSA